MKDISQGFVVATLLSLRSKAFVVLAITLQLSFFPCIGTAQDTEPKGKEATAKAAAEKKAAEELAKAAAEELAKAAAKEKAAPWGFSRFKTDYDYDPEKVLTSTSCEAVTEKQNGSEIKKYVCNPEAIFIHGPTTSTVTLLDLPPAVYKITLTAGENWVHPELNYDEKFYKPPLAPGSVVHLDLHLRRNFDPSFGGFWGCVETAKERLRDKAHPDRRLSLLLSGKRRRVSIDVSYMEVEKAGDQPVEKTLSISLDLLYQRWWVDAGGFYAFHRSKDQVISTRSVTDEKGDAMVEVLSLSRHDRATQTGIQSTFFPGNYPEVGITFGVAENSGRDPSYFLGPSLRLMGLGKNAVVSFTIGAILVPQRRYQLKVGETYLANDPRLEGSVDQELDLFLGINLGFSIGGSSKPPSGK